MSKVSLYAKINGLEPKLSQALGRYSSEQLSSVVAEFTQAGKIILPEYEVRIIDGNHIGGTEHRLKVLRAEGSSIVNRAKTPSSDKINEQGYSIAL